MSACGSTAGFDFPLRQCAVTARTKPGPPSVRGVDSLKLQPKAAIVTFWNLSLSRAFVAEEEKHHDQ